MLHKTVRHVRHVQVASKIARNNYGKVSVLINWQWGRNLSNKISSLAKFLMWEYTIHSVHCLASIFHLAYLDTRDALYIINIENNYTQTHRYTLFTSIHFKQWNVDYKALMIKIKNKCMLICNLFTHGAPRSSQQLVQKCPWIPGSNWNLEMLVFLGEGKTGIPREEPLGAE